MKGYQSSKKKEKKEEEQEREKTNKTNQYDKILLDMFSSCLLFPQRQSPQRMQHAHDPNPCEYNFKIVLREHHISSSLPRLHHNPRTTAGEYHNFRSTLGEHHIVSSYCISFSENTTTPGQPQVNTTTSGVPSDNVTYPVVSPDNTTSPEQECEWIPQLQEYPQITPFS